MSNQLEIHDETVSKVNRVLELLVRSTVLGAVESIRKELELDEESLTEDDLEAIISDLSTQDRLSVYANNILNTKVLQEHIGQFVPDRL